MIAAGVSRIGSEESSIQLWRAIEIGKHGTFSSEKISRET
jgi:hypothetical protein